MKKSILICIFCGLLLTACEKTDAAETSSNTTTQVTTSTPAEVEATSVTTTVTTITTGKSDDSKLEETKPTTTNLDNSTDKVEQSSDDKKNEDEKVQVGIQSQGNVQKEKPKDQPKQSDSKKENNTTSKQGNKTPAVTNPPSPTTKPTTTPTKATTTTAKPKDKGISQSDINEINKYIKEVAKSYGIGTKCSACNNEGAIILSGNVDPWNGYAWDTPVAGDFHDTVSEYKTGVAIRIKTMYNEWKNDGTTSEEISWGIFIQIYWEKKSNGKYDLYLMW